MYALREATLTERFGERHGKPTDQLAKQREEHENNMAYERALTAVSLQMDFTPVDYAPQLAMQSFPEKAIPSYDYLIAEALKRTRGKYNLPLAIQMALAVVLPLAVVFFPNMFTYGALIAIGAVLAVTVKFTFRRRDRAKKMAIMLAKEEIHALIKEEKEKRDNERKVFEADERVRVAEIEALLNGDIGPVAYHIEERFKKLRYPFDINITVDMYSSQLFYVTVELPPKAVVPVRTSSLLASGKIDYQDKPNKVINKQYAEIVSALALTAAGCIYSIAPSSSDIVVAGILSNESSDGDVDPGTCLISFSTNREDFYKTNIGYAAFAAISAFSPEFWVDSNYNLKPVKPCELPIPLDEEGPTQVVEYGTTLSQEVVVQENTASPEKQGAQGDRYQEDEQEEPENGVKTKCSFHICVKAQL